MLQMNRIDCLVANHSNDNILTKQIVTLHKSDQLEIIEFGHGLDTNLKHYINPCPKNEQFFKEFLT